MPRLMILLSLLPITLALAARWWFGMRVLLGDGRRSCRCDLKRWLPLAGDEATVHRAEASAAEYGRQFRIKALAAWRERDPRAAAARENSRRFGLAVPPFSGIIALFAVIVGKVPLMGGIAIFIGATAVSALFGLLTLPPELAALSQAARTSRENGDFPDRNDHEAVVRCAIAHAWELAIPPILRLIHR